jgi:hypothetical protein
MGYCAESWLTLSKSDYINTIAGNLNDKMISSVVIQKEKMKYIEHIAKESLEVLRRSVLRSWMRQCSNEVYTLVNQLNTNGFAVVENFWSIDRCVNTIKQIELEIGSLARVCQHWIDNEESDYRLYNAENISEELTLFLYDPFIEVVRKHYSGISTPEKLLLAGRLIYTHGNRGSGGGWHRDSPHSSQFKALLYLSDVDKENGPFQYLEGTHSSISSLDLLKSKLCFPNQSRFSEEEIQDIIKSGFSSHIFTAPAGTLILVDTKGIHRGMPMQSGHRYALTQYCFNSSQGKSKFIKRLKTD